MDIPKEASFGTRRTVDQYYDARRYGESEALRRSGYQHEAAYVRQPVLAAAPEHGGAYYARPHNPRAYNNDRNTYKFASRHGQDASPYDQHAYNANRDAYESVPLYEQHYFTSYNPQSYHKDRNAYRPASPHGQDAYPYDEHAHNRDRDRYQQDSFTPCNRRSYHEDPNPYQPASRHGYAYEHNDYDDDDDEDDQYEDYRKVSSC